MHRPRLTSLSRPTRHAPHAAMAAATLGVAASAALDPRPPWSGTIRQATDQLVLATTSRSSNARNIGVLCVFPVHRRAPLHGASGGGARSAPDHPSSWLAVEFPTTHPSCPSPSAGAPRVLPPTLPPTLPTLPPIPTAPPSAATRRVRIVPSRGGLGAFSGWRR